MCTKQTIFRFQPCEDSRINSISACAIWLSDPTRFNDDTDLKPKIRDRVNFSVFKDVEQFEDMIQVLASNNPEVGNTLLLGKADVLGSPANMIKDHAVNPNLDFTNFFKEKFIDHIQNFGVTCFAPRLEMPAMWAYYAANATGFALEYELELGVKATAQRSFEGYAFLNVDYSSEFDHEYCVSELIFTPTASLKRLVAKKSTAWAHEEEIRLVYVDGKAGNFPIPYGLRLKAIYAGKKSSAKHRDQLANVAARESVMFSSM